MYFKYLIPIIVIHILILAITELTLALLNFNDGNSLKKAVYLYFCFVAACSSSSLTGTPSNAFGGIGLWKDALLGQE